MSQVSSKSFEIAWAAREKRGELARIHETALRLFYGPGEVHPSDPLSCWGVDGYGDYLWITEWEHSSAGRGPSVREVPLEEIARCTEAFYSKQGYLGAVVLMRPRQGIPEKPQMLWGQSPPDSFVVVEGGPGEGSMRFEIRLLDSRHPGLFLDHLPLRLWLANSGRVRGKSVLNTFAYTGSLSIASWSGGAASVTTLDLSKPTVEWARRNAVLNGIPEEQSRFIAGDFFEDVPRLARRKESFDVVISDPPSFSRGKKRTFSTQKDLVDLHEVLLSVLAPGGLLITSINSANVPWDKYEREVAEAARRSGRRLKLLQRIEQPATFPDHPANPKSRYLKGFIFES